MTTQDVVRVDQDSLRELLGSNPSIDAAALYGSVARGDIERHSDVDLLLVCSSSRKRPAFFEVQRLLGGCFNKISITVYSERELKFLRSAGSLFLLHLSREAIVLLDRSDFLKNLLTNFLPKPSYRQDFQKSLQLLDPLKLVVEGAPNNFHRSSYIYSLFRVFGVYLLAETGIYEFSKSRMTQLLADKFPSKRESLELLATLRALNSNFFSGGTYEGNNRTSSCVLQHTKALASLAHVEMEISQVPYENAVHLFEESLGQRKCGLDYRLRMWFLILVYDGLNLFRCRTGDEPLTDFSESALLELKKRSPEPIRFAIQEAVSHLHRYPLKYFLNDSARIDVQSARRALQGISDELARR